MTLSEHWTAYCNTGLYDEYPAFVHAWNAALEEAAKECWKASDELSDRHDMTSEQGMAQLLATRIRTLKETP
jgi:hypothetical protein